MFSRYYPGDSLAEKGASKRKPEDFDKKKSKRFYREMDLVLGAGALLAVGIAIAAAFFGRPADAAEPQRVCDDPQTSLEALECHRLEQADERLVRLGEKWVRQRFAIKEFFEVGAAGTARLVAILEEKAEGR